MMAVSVETSLYPSVGLYTERSIIRGVIGLSPHISTSQHPLAFH